MKLFKILLTAFAIFTCGDAHASANSKGYFEVKVERVDQGSSMDSILLRGTVSARSSFSSLKVFWVLPEDVEVLGGQTTINTAIQKGETQSYEITVKANSSENRKIHFIVNETVENDGTNLGASAQYNTNPKRGDESADQESEVKEQRQSKPKDKAENKVKPRVKLKKPQKIFQ